MSFVKHTMEGFDIGDKLLEREGAAEIRHFIDKTRQLTVTVSRDPTRHGLLYHLSIAHPTRLPRWDELKYAREHLLPLGKDFMMLLPQSKDYVNLHNYCFHLWETPVEWGIR